MSSAYVRVDFAHSFVDSMQAMHRRSMPPKECRYSMPLRTTNLVDYLLISILLVGLSRRRPRSRKSRNGVRQSSNCSVVILPKTSSGADFGDNSERGINSLCPDIVMLHSSPLGVERDAARDAKAPAFAFAASRAWSILTSWGCQ